MYREEELTGVRQQIRRRRIWMLLPLVPALAAVIGAIHIRFGLQANTVLALHDPDTMARITRCEWVVYIVSGLAAAWLVLYGGLMINPLKRYTAFLDGVLHGPRHTVQGAWAGVSGDLSAVDGVTFRAVGLTVADDKGRDYERLFYWDAEKPLPDCPAGVCAEITYHGKMVADFRACDPQLGSAPV